MSKLTYCSRWGGAIAVAAIVGCGGGAVASHGPRPAQLARHFDSLAAVERDGNRVFFLTEMEIAAAYGAAPVAVTVTTHEGTQVWQGFMAKFTAMAPPHDSAYAILAYSDDTLTNALFARLHFRGGGRTHPEVWMLTGDTVFTTGGSGSMTGETVARIGTCVTTPGLQNGPTDMMIGCELRQFTGSLTWAFPTTKVVIAPQSFYGADYGYALK
jgi:hypothetical protein